MVLVGGLLVLVPLLAFEVFVEAGVLKRLWRLPYGQLCRFTLGANLWSLLAGIPAKVLNSCVCDRLLPGDIPGYFGRYPMVATLSAANYFIITLVVEAAYARYWCRRKQLGFKAGTVWRGILLANLATYAVLTPLDYYLTRPWTEIREFANDTRWTQHPETTVLFVDTQDGFLKSVRADGTGLQTIVPVGMTDYLISSNLDVCLFRGTNGSLNLFQHGREQTELIWKTDERFFMTQVAFSPACAYVAYASKNEDAITVLNLVTGQRAQLAGMQEFNFDGPQVAWSPEETRIFVRGLKANPNLTVTIEPDGTLKKSTGKPTHDLTLAACYGRVDTSDSRWYGGGDRGVSFPSDKCNGLTARAWPGLDSGLSISRQDGERSDRVLGVSVRPGLLHLADFDFGDVAFLSGGSECIFEANGYLYLLDIPGRRLGTVAHGGRFILLTPRYEKKL
jgi:hypothetical protein